MTIKENSKMQKKQPDELTEESECPPLSSCSKDTLLQEQKSGQFICYKTGQFYLLLTGIKKYLNHLPHSMSAGLI
jgi:hypothetical protein